jgi:hypothetical protein
MYKSSKHENHIVEQLWKKAAPSSKKNKINLSLLLVEKYEFQKHPLKAPTLPVQNLYRFAGHVIDTTVFM